MCWHKKRRHFISQGMQKVTRVGGMYGTGAPSQLLKGVNTADTWIANFQPLQQWEKKFFSHLSHAVCGILLQQPPNTNITWNAYMCTHAATLCLAHVCVCVCVCVWCYHWCPSARLFLPFSSFQKIQWEDLVHFKKCRVMIIQRIAPLFSKSLEEEQETHFYEWES